MSYTHIGCHTKTVAAFADLLVDLQLSTKKIGPKGIEYTRARNTPKSGFQVSGPHGIPRDTGAKDGEGFPIMEVIPGFHWNIRVWGTIAEGKALDDLTMGDVATKGDLDNTKLPAGRETTNGRVYKLDDPTIIKTPYNVWA